MAKAAAGTTVEAYETIRVDNGRPIQVSVSVSPIRDAAGKIIGVSKIARDITGRKRAEEAMRESEERLRAIVGTAVDAIVVIDEAARIHSINPAGERIFGYTHSELTGKTFPTSCRTAPLPPRDYIESYYHTGKPKFIGRPGSAAPAQGPNRIPPTLPSPMVGWRQTLFHRCHTGHHRAQTARRQDSGSFCAK